MSNAQKALVMAAGIFLAIELQKFSDQDQFGLQIVTGKNSTGQWYGKIINICVPMDSVTYDSVVGEAPDRLDFAMDEADINCLNPSGKFRAQLVRDRSNVIRGIVFRQQ